MYSLSGVTHHNLERTLCISLAVILMAALTSTLLYSIFRCFTRRRNHSTHHPVTASNCDEALAGIPVSIYVVPTISAASPTLDFDHCSICLAAFRSGETVRVLPRCRHVFHKACIDQWMPLRSLCCPVCRDRTIEQDGEPTTRTNCTNNGTTANRPSALLALTFANNAHIPIYL